MVSDITEAKTGHAFEYRYSLTKPVDIAAKYPPHGLVGLTAVAEIKDARGKRLHRFAMQDELQLKDELVFVCDDSVTLDWVVGEYVFMDILFSNGVPTGRFGTETINILVLKGITRAEAAVGAQKVYARESWTAGYKTEASAS